MTRDPTTAVWRKSTRSSAMANCVEAAGLDDGRAVRDSKDPAGPMLRFTAAAWSAFIWGIRTGDFD